MTSQVMDAPHKDRHRRAMSPRPFHTLSPATHAGQHLRQLRRQAGLSQLGLSLACGISQRHLSCIETGRAKAGPGTLHALLSALDVPLEQCNEVFLAAGYAPRYQASALDTPALEMIHRAIEHLLRAQDPAPAIALDSDWNIIATNAGAMRMVAMTGEPVADTQGLNLLETLLRPGGLGDHLVNAAQIRALTWQRANREALGNPGLARRLQDLPTPEALPQDDEPSPLILTRVRTADGELTFLSTFTTFGMPLDISVASLRIEHLIPADEQTWAAMRSQVALPTVSC